MTTRYYEERVCEHGDVGPHGIGVNARVTGRVDCPGGQRRELTDVQVVDALYQLGSDGRFVWRVELPGSGRYAIVPLEEPADG